MLAIHTYVFQIGSKIPFSEWPQIVQAYLQQHALSYERFLYYFQDSHGGLEKAVKESPQLEPIRLHPPGSVSRKYLSNIEDGIGADEAEIMRLMPKIYRRYGFSDTYLIYQDVDFFSERIPAVVQGLGNTPSCIKGASITCYRDSVFPRLSSISLRIVIGDEHGVKDPTSYLEGMQALLPKIRYTEHVECVLTAEEQALYDRLNETAAPLVEAARDYSESRLPHPAQQAFRETPQLSAAPVMKKLCKRFGFTYIKHESGVISVLKRTPKGHCIVLNVDVTPLGRYVNGWIDFKGAGFRHRIGDFDWNPRNQKELEAYLLDVFVALADMEREVIPSLDAHFPPTPSWFIPLT